MKKDLLIFIKHIEESIKNVESFSKDLTRDKLSKNKLKQSAIIMQIEIIGEAINNLPSDFTKNTLQSHGAT